MGKLFGTDGIRGVANVAPMDVETMLQVGRATAHFCREQGASRRHRIVIGKDTRVSGYMIENALTAGICSMGVDVFLLGPIPTPAIAMITHSMRADAGLVISASHNPYQDNGIKIFSREGYKLPDEAEREVEDLVASGRIRDIRPTAHDVGKARRIDDAIGRYIVFCKNTFPDELSLDGMKLVLDCAQGATYKVAPIIFSELGAEVEALAVEPNGLNINDQCGSQYTASLRARVRETGADAGLAFDGDGDRLIAVDETGEELTGDHIMAVCARYYLESGRLNPPLVVSTAMSNLGFFKALEGLGIRREEAPVGDRHVLERMMGTGAILGGEASGHIIFHDLHTTGDGIVSALQLLAASRKAGAPLSSLARVLSVYPQRLVNLPVSRRVPLEELDSFQDTVRAVEEELGDGGRVLVRYSGTQPLCRIMVEAADDDTTLRLCERLSDALRKAILE